MKNIFMWIILLGLFSSNLFARGSKKPSTDAPPTQLRITLTRNPSTEASIIWNNNYGNPNDDVIYIDSTDYGQEIDQYSTKFSPTVSHDYKGMMNTVVRLKELNPDTTYYFVIKNTYGLSRRYFFKTAPNLAKKMSFIAGGDSRNNRSPRRKANSLVSKLNVNAVFFGGDMTDRGSSSQWQDWMNDWQLTIRSDGRVTPIVPARGNHENSDEMLVKLFDTPNKVYYAMNFGGNLLRTYTLNSERSPAGDQSNWLLNDLRDHENIKFKMAQYHKPMRPHTSKKRNGKSVYRGFSQFFYDFGVNLVVECDSHMVKQTWPIKPSDKGDDGFEVDLEKGTVYVGEGTWGAPTRTANKPRQWTRDLGKFNQFKWIFVTPTKIEVRTVKIDNADQVIPLPKGEKSRFQIPENLDLWRPKNGDVLEINKAN